MRRYMKTLVRLLPLFLLPFFLGACSQSHFLKEEAYRNKVLDDFERKKEALPNGDLFSIFSQADLSVAEREALMFLYAYMPIGDLTDYPGEYYLENYRLSEQARAEMSWGKDIPDKLFRHFVLPVRVNNENLDDSRRVFYQELKERVKGLSMKEAILEVNHWCHEKVVYRPSDARTSSPLASVKTAYGRCGEESTFTVAALRSVGIPARQVYTPRWAHTDDNHAWVEAWADGEWYFFGACEPEPVLNLGWFNAPASRGMLMHTKVFGHYDGPEEIMRETSKYTEINVIDNYAPTAKVTVRVTDEKGAAVAGAKVEFKVYNYAEFYTVAAKHTDTEGKAALTAGKGDMLVWVSKDGRFGYRKVSFGKEDTVEVALDRKEGDAHTLELDITPPAEGANLPEVSPEMRAENDRRLAQEDSIRNAYVATMMTEERAEAALKEVDLASNTRSSMVKMLVASRGNYQTLLDFVQTAQTQDKQELAVELLQALSAKDWRDVSATVLEDIIRHAPDPRKVGMAASVRVANQRVANEMLTPYRGFFNNVIPQADAEAFVKNPVRLVEWCKENIKIDNGLNSQRIPISPAGVWKAKVADEKSRDIFFVAMARTLGIPAWIDEVTGKVQYMDENPFMENGKEVRLKEGRLFDVDFLESVPSQASAGLVSATYKPVPSLDDPKYYSHFTLSVFKDGTFRLLNYDEGDVDMGGGATWANLLKRGARLDAGYYMLVTGTRLASGAVLSRLSFFNVASGGRTVTDLVMRESKDAVQVIGSFNSESLYRPIGTDKANQTSASCGSEPNETAGECSSRSLLQACGRGYFVVGILGVGQEPTNHALRDIAARSAELEKWGRKIVLLFSSEEQYKKFRPDEFPGLPSTIIYGIDSDNSIRKQIVTSMKLSGQTNLPLFIISDTFNRVVFVSQGYTIGLGEQLLKVIHGL